ncbi:hypothetical protein PMAYCL1PPCAC_15545, partial [Pristionchus mayeri]
VLGIALCAFLLYCLIFRTRQDLGIYRYLQRIITAEGMFAMIPTSSFGVTKEVLCLYLAVYNLTWVMIDYNFLYRLWAVKSFASVYYLFTPTTSGRLTMREETLKEYGIDTTSHVMIMGDYFLAIIPLIFLYCPCGMMILLPLTRLDSSWMARATPLLISCFLPLDALAVLLSMTEYRQELMRIIR